MSLNLTAALEYAERGWRVFPCAGKKPATAHGFKDATADLEQITKWWTKTPNASIGLYADGSGLVIIDVDPAKGGADSLANLKAQLGEEVFETRTSLTGGGGWHLFYLRPDGARLPNDADVAGLPGIDLRTAGYVILPPSRHPSGDAYQWLNDLSITPMDPRLVELLRTPTPEPDATPRVFEPNPLSDARERAYAESALDLELRELAAQQPGGQNAALNKCAFALGQLVGGGLLSRSDVECRIEQVVLAWPCSNRVWTRSNMAQTLRSGIESGIRSPRGVPPEEPLRRSSTKPKEVPTPMPEPEPSMVPEKPGEGQGSTAPEPEPVKTKEVDEKCGKTCNQIACAWAELVADSYIYTSNDQWWEYNAGRWMMVDDAYVGRSVREFALPTLGNSVTPRKITDIVRMAQYLLLHGVTEMGGALHLIPFRNGVYSMRDGSFSRHDPANLLTRQLHYDYDTDAQCPRFIQFLSEVLVTQSGDPCQEWIDVMQEWFGYLLLAESSAQTAMVWLGGGQNGKGVLTKVIEAFVGSDNVTAIAVDQLKDPYHRADLFGKMLGTTGDLDKKDMRSASGWFKAIVGGDTISARHPAGKVFHFRPSLRMVISCNALPDTQDMSYGYFRRLLIIDFRANIPDARKIADLDQRFVAEMSGIFNWALEGLRRFEANGRKFTESPESAAVKAEYRAQQDPVAGFLAECCERSEEEDCWAWVDTLYDSYVAYCFRESLKTASRGSFGMGLSQNGIQSAVSGWDTDSGSNRKLRNGICLRPGK